MSDYYSEQSSAASMGRDGADRMAAGLGICVDEERGDLDEVLRLRAEIARLREERKPVAWCVQAAARAMVHAGTHIPVSEPVLIQCTDEADARMLSAVYGHRVLVIVEADTKEVPRE